MTHLVPAPAAGNTFPKNRTLSRTRCHGDARNSHPGHPRNIHGGSSTKLCTTFGPDPGGTRSDNAKQPCLVVLRRTRNAPGLCWDARSRSSLSSPFRLTLFRLSACLGGVSVGKRFGLELALFVCRIRFRLNSYSTPSATVVVVVVDVVMELAVAAPDAAVPPAGSKRVEPANDCLHESPNLLDTIWSSV
uniref:Uncharacterized protein n=1 Tax=Anopheles merus TaxID=30066 RepID=A0A182VBI5_ANOME